MFVWNVVAIGALAAFIVGVSKTALPGAGLLATPLFALIVDGRAIAGTTLPILIVADIFAVSWYRHHARWDVLKPLIASVSVGFLAGATFFVAVGSNTRILEIVIAIIILFVVALQTYRAIRRSTPRPATMGTAIAYGTTGGFTTFVSNTAGPIMNTYLVGLGLQKESLVGTTAWFYFAVNAAKLPFYVAIGRWTAGGGFFTAEHLLFDLALLPAVVVGVFAGKHTLHRLPDRLFLFLVLFLSAAGGLKLLLG